MYQYIRIFIVAVFACSGFSISICHIYVQTWLISPNLSLRMKRSMFKILNAWVFGIIAPLLAFFLKVPNISPRQWPSTWPFQLSQILDLLPNVFLLSAKGCLREPRDTVADMPTVCIWKDHLAMVQPGNYLGRAVILHGVGDILTCSLMSWQGIASLPKGKCPVLSGMGQGHQCHANGRCSAGESHDTPSFPDASVHAVLLWEGGVREGTHLHMNWACRDMTAW
jgi:hypothetical protein